MPMKTEANTQPLWKLQRTEMESGSKNRFGKLRLTFETTVQCLHYSLSEFEYQDYMYLDNTHSKNCLDKMCSFVFYTNCPKYFQLFQKL